MTKTVTLRTSSKQMEALEKLAREQERSVSQIVRRAVDAYLKAAVEDSYPWSGESQ